MNNRPKWILGLKLGGLAGNGGRGALMGIGWAALAAAPASTRKLVDLHSAGVRIFPESAHMTHPEEDWTVDLESAEARHRELAIVVRFTRDLKRPGEWTGEIVSGQIPQARWQDAPRLMREAGDAFVFALRA